MEENTVTTPQLPPPENPAPQTTSSDDVKQSRQRVIIATIVAVIILGLIIFGIVMLAVAPEGTTARVRDIFIIFMALESLVLGVALIVLIIQLATLINLLQNEIKPILDTTNETVNNLRGTTVFLSNNLVQPIIKMNEYLAGLKKLFDMLRPDRR